jgi:hypothetical protein
MDGIAQSLLEAQPKAATLFQAVVSEGLIQAGKSESELSRASLRSPNHDSGCDGIGTSGSCVPARIRC